MTKSVVAIDLGAATGRVYVGSFARGRITIEPIARFSNAPVTMIDGLHWNITGLWSGILTGLTDAIRMRDDVLSVGIDSWGADYALLRAGRLVGIPYAYRDSRGGDGAAKAAQLLPASELYARNGLESLPFNSLYQLLVDQAAGAMEVSDAVLFIPDLIGFWLTGEGATEPTIASTSGLLRADSRSWDADLVQLLGLPATVMPPLLQPGDELGRVSGRLVNAVAPPHSRLTAMKVASHDTAAAVVATPFEQTGSAYLSCGTWALIGVEVSSPILSDAARAQRFTNEAAADGQVLFQKNLMGLGLLNDLVGEAPDHNLRGILAEAARVTLAPDQLIDPADSAFLQPRRTSVLIREWLQERGVQAPSTLAAFARCVVESLASAFARALSELEIVAGANIAAIHIVGGGSQNSLLCQLTADRSGRPVVAGPVEASVLGNVIIQGQSLGLVPSSPQEARKVVRASFPLVRYEPC